ncbi:Nma111p [Sugiyamaella lignohabitans]|uniref:Pro-apoptotic serine protease NMA111 n=1 Tax=Sugiyamaella lignohabitans TaxID=796027 RepID=A0A167D4K2_9ASCO|nr:Nma111p [Sugiyamaella lignohabitans]ANB12470.1 Nma111p [Sugiyamaella lignohabitans]
MASPPLRRKSSRLSNIPIKRRTSGIADSSPESSSSSVNSVSKRLRTDPESNATIQTINGLESSSDVIVDGNSSALANDPVVSTSFDVSMDDVNNEQFSNNEESELDSEDESNNVVILDDKKLVKTEVLPPSSTTAAVTSSSTTTAMESVEWQKTTERVVKSVVSVQFASVCSFDTEGAFVSEATGFVVDAEQGIIMTNRHVVGSGPFVGYAVFDNHEECDVKPIYRDPVHDFGFLKFDPKRIKHMKVQALELRPDLARVGCEIRVVGNDAGEKLSILAGFISRLDRNAPDYGDLTYNDFNTEYIQAAASTSGGSSGSPVVNIDGNVVALQAGGSTSASTDFFLPLYRGKRALECIRAGQPVTRGTIQAQFLLKPFDECRRLGLTEEAENLARKSFPDAIGLLVAETILPEGPSDGLIREGDCLISINGEQISRFSRVDAILDESIGKEISVTVQRGGKNITSSILVGDLHAITPDRFVTVNGSIFHNISYQIARLYSIPVRGVYVADAGGSFGPERGDATGWILDELDDQPTPDLDAFIEVMKSIADGKRVSARFRHVTDLHTIRYSIVYIDRHWHKSMSLAVRNDVTGLWDYEELGKPLPAEPVLPQKAKFVDLYLENDQVSKLVRSFVKVAARVGSKIEGYYSSSMTEYGLVIDAEKGYVLVTRYTVPHDLLDIYVTVAESVIVPGKVVFMHPLQNYAIVQYDPSLVDAPIESAKLSSTPLKQGTPVVFVGHNHNLRVVSTKTRVTDISTVVIPLSPEVSPRYRGTNLDSVAVDTPLSGDCGSGVLADEDGTIRALWMSFLGDSTGNGRDRQYRLALDITLMRSVIDQLRAGERPNPRVLDVEVNAIQVVNSRIRGVGEEWIRKVEESNNERHQLFNVIRVAQSAAGSLREGDILLAINGKLVTRVLDLNAAQDADEVEVTLVRNRKEMTVTVPTIATDDLATDRVLSWCGINLHKPHHAVVQQLKKSPSDVYVVYSEPGSPANQYGISSTYFITDVNGEPTPNLDRFLEVVSKIPDNTYVKLRIVTFDNLPCACSIKTNYHYFPTSERVRNAAGKWESFSFEDGVRKLI